MPRIVRTLPRKSFTTLLEQRMDSAKSRAQYLRGICSKDPDGALRSGEAEDIAIELFIYRSCERLLQHVEDLPDSYRERTLARCLEEECSWLSRRAVSSILAGRGTDLGVRAEAQLCEFYQSVLSKGGGG